MSKGPNIIPRYAQIAGVLRAELESGHYVRGSCLPSIDHLAGRFKAAPQTMRQAISVLEEEALLQRRQGVGTVVRAVPHDQRWLLLPTDWDSLVHMLEELRPDRTLIEDSNRRPDLPDDGGLFPSYKYFKRVHSRNGRPFCVIGIYLASEVFLMNPEEFRNELVVLALSRQPGLKIANVRQTLRLDVADAETADLLNIAMAGPIARVRRIIRNEKNEVIYLADVAYRGDVLALDMDLTPTERPINQPLGRKI